MIRAMRTAPPNERMQQTKGRSPRLRPFAADPRCWADMKAVLGGLGQRLVCVALVLGAASHSAGSEPTLEETQAWLRGHLSTVLVYDHEGRRLTRTLEATFPTRCELVLADQVSDGKTEWGTTSEAALSELDAAHHRSGVLLPGVWSLEVPAREGRASISLCIGPPDCHTGTGASDTLLFLFGDPEMPERASKALSHAIRLCGGSDDIF